MDSVSGVPDDAAELHHEVMSAQSAGQAPLPNGVGGVREDHHPSTSTTREPERAPLVQYGSVDRAVEGNVVAQVPRDEAQPPPVAAADRTLQAPANTGEEPGPQQAGLMQALTTIIQDGTQILEAC